jgi:hypothetical protein
MFFRIFVIELQTKVACPNIVQTHQIQELFVRRLLGLYPQVRL